MRLSDVRACRPAALHGAARDFASAERLLDQLIDRLDAEVRARLASGWRGAASSAALAYVDRLRRDLAQARDRAGTAGRAVAQLAEALAEAQPLVVGAERIAHGERLQLGEDGRVDIPALPWPTTEDEHRRRLDAAEEAHRLLARGLGTATAADLACARELASAPVGAGAPGAAFGAAVGAGLARLDQWPFNVFGRDDPSIFSDLWGGLQWLDNVGDYATFVDHFAEGLRLLRITSALEGVGSVAGGVSDLINPFPAVVGNIVDGVQIYDNILGEGGLVDQGNPIDAFESRGSDYVADVFETGFNVSTTAYAMQPYNPVLAGAVVVTGIGWATSAHWDKIEAASAWAWDTAGGAVEWGMETGGDLLDSAEDVWDSGTGLVSDVAGGLGDAAGGLGDAIGL